MRPPKPKVDYPCYTFGTLEMLFSPRSDENTVPAMLFEGLTGAIGTFRVIGFIGFIGVILAIGICRVIGFIGFIRFIGIIGVIWYLPEGTIVGLSGKTPGPTGA